jgi:hypothetical protein
MKIRAPFLALLLLVGFLTPSWAGEGLQLHEQEIKAGLLYNFLKYVTWPQGATGGMSVCLYGDSSFNSYLEPMAGRTVNQQKISVHTIHTPQEVANCRLVFVNDTEGEHWPDIAKTIATQGILSVSDYEGFAENGGMIEFGRKDEHIAVTLNIDATAAAHLHVEDRLLQLVTVIHGGSTHQEGRP